tara:strand:+ start:1958 stop:3400 length:1443 start_codon:yes stop_codon:yes gene_type:complete
MPFKKIYSAIVIGSGAGSASLVDTLINNGTLPEDILVLERGVFPDQYSNTSAAERFIKFYENSGTLPCLGNPIIPYGVANCVGGGPEINGSLIWKTPEHIKDDWFTNYNLPFKKNKFNFFLERFEEILKVKSSTITQDHDYSSFLLNKAAKALKINCVPARRAITSHCCSDNLCAFGSINGTKNTVYQMIFKSHLNIGLKILSNIRNINFHILKKDGPYEIEFLHSKKLIRLRTKQIYLSAGSVNSPALLSRILGKRFHRFKLKFHLNLKSIGLLQEELPDVPGTMFSAQVQEYKSDNQYIMPFNWHKAHVKSILDRHEDSIQFDYVFKHGLGLTSQVTNSKVEANLNCFSSNKKSFTLINHNIFKNSEVFDSIYEIMNRTFALYQSIGITKVLCPIPSSSILKIEDSLNEIKKSNYNLDLLSVHHMGSLPLGSKLISFNGSVRDFPNIFIADSSLLPTFVGESPQLTIMAFIASLYANK